jgi:Penicillin-insensitive murein endopeptidase
MTWRPNELWLDTDVLWFREAQGAFAAAGIAVDGHEGLFAPVATGLEASRARRRAAAQSARRRRLATRTVPAVALVVGSATMLPIAWLRHGEAASRAQPLQEDPPSLTYRLDGLFGDVTEAVDAPVRRWAVASRRWSAARATPVSARAADLADVKFRHARSVGLPYSGYLVGGTQLPVSGPDWVTWDPITDSVPNQPVRLYGNEHTIKTVISVIAASRPAHPHAPKVVVGDISRRDGGPMDDHVSHQNGLDVDVYYPRRDDLLRAPIAVSQIDHHLAQDLLDRFVAAGAKMIFVGYSTRLHGPSGVVIPYPNHDNHMHVRFPPPGG